ncbi:NAD(P)/FAD-dependent oxidoreductase [Falsigemmobacter intermedius]|uniref:FAD-binding oxidoreductase n=1 Tax=Falsigemmobacter intermedius TaxID=1553448 RepID=A0A3S3WJC6_9RHOB|nr:FAD-binding oxidoreductase [Falsigemmobacter intermedius]RWY39493.1 FAD-binding oxidoreductase [Falsigemmobacter intermedius]
MTQNFDVVVIGGAVSGASAAFWLTRMQPELRAAVIERDPGYAFSATALSVASVRSQFSNPVNVQISRFGVEFIRNFGEELALEPGQGDLGLKENGYLFLGASAEAPGQLEELAAMQRGFGAATEVLNPEAIAKRFPWMKTEDLSAGSFGHRDEGWFDNMGLLGGFRAAARRQGVVFLKDEAVGLELEGTRITAVKLASGARLGCGAVVNAAGTRASQVMEWAGLTLPVEPRKRTVFVIDAPNARHPEAPLIIDYQGYYMRPEHQGWITATVPEGDGPCAVDDFEPDAHLFEEVIWPMLYNRSEGFDACRVQRLWVGHYDYNTLDQNAILGAHPARENLYLMNGFSGHGLQQSPATGRGIAELILTGGYRSLDLSDLGVERVLAGRPFLEMAIV